MVFDLSRLRAPAAAPHEAASAQRPSILIVCTGNVCRSPLAALVLRARLSDLDLDIGSAGTHALVGQGMTPDAAALAIARGVGEADAAGHRAAWLRESDLTAPDLVLTMERGQRRHVVELAPTSVARTFTLREFARLAEGIDGAPSSLPQLVAQVAARRGLADGPADPADDDVIDPYRRSSATYERSAAQLDPAVADLERVVRGALVPELR